MEDEVCIHQKYGFCKYRENKAKAISAKLLELNLKKKLKETGKTRGNKKKREETEKLEEKNT